MGRINSARIDKLESDSNLNRYREIIEVHAAAANASQVHEDARPYRSFDDADEQSSIHYNQPSYMRKDADLQ